MEKEKEYLDKLLMKKRYEDLSDEEKKWVHEHLMDEGSYRKLHSIIHSIASEPEMNVDPSVKRDLVSLMKSRNEPTWRKVVDFKLPLYQSIGLLVLLMIFYSFIMQPSTKIVEKTVYVPTDPIFDTIFVESSPDTVFVERVLEKTVYLTQQIEPEETPSGNISVQSKSLAEEIELEDLLVRSE